MEISKKDFFAVATSKGLKQEQIIAIWEELQDKHINKPGFSFSNVSYYFGGLLIIVAMTIFLGVQAKHLHLGGFATLLTLYGLAFFFAGKTLWSKPQFRTPAGLLLTVPIFLVPVILCSFLIHFNIWQAPINIKGPEAIQLIREKMIVLEVATILFGVFMIIFFPFPFMVAPIGFSMWLVALHISAMIYGNTFLEPIKIITTTVYFSLIMIFISYLIDRRTKQDFSFWFYLFGVLSFWTSLSCLHGMGELSKSFYGCINLIMIFLSVLLQRRIFIICGAIGFLSYLGFLANTVFQGAIEFSFALSIIGILFIYITIKFQKYKQQINTFILNYIPHWLKSDLPMNRKYFHNLD